MQIYRKSAVALTPPSLLSPPKVKVKSGAFSDPNILLTSALQKLQRKSEVCPLFPVKPSKPHDSTRKKSALITTSNNRMNCSSFNIGFGQMNPNCSTVLDLKQPIKSSAESQTIKQKQTHQKNVSSITLNKNLITLLENKSCKSPSVNEIENSLKRLQSMFEKNQNINNHSLVNYNQQLLQKCAELIKIAENQKNDTQSTSTQRHNEKVEKLQKQLQEERKQRLMVEEQTSKMISQQEREIQCLENKIRSLQLQIQQNQKNQ